MMNSIYIITSSPYLAVPKSALVKVGKTGGGFKAFGQHVKEVCSQFDHVDVHNDIWTTPIAKTSASSHLFLKAVQLLETKGHISKDAIHDNNSLFEIVT